ncbi:MAG: hypothetical protein LWX11_02350 [Firmicutes bacterium]|nr:hypothetical protein [Bacillota bacterium]
MRRRGLLILLFLVSAALVNAEGPWREWYLLFQTPALKGVHLKSFVITPHAMVEAPQPEAAWSR